MIRTLCKCGEMKHQRHFCRRNSWGYIANAEQTGVEQEGPPEAQTRGKATQGSRQTGAESRAEAKRGEGVDCSLPSTPHAPQYLPRMLTRHPHPHRDTLRYPRAALLVCRPHMQASSSFIHVCGRPPSKCLLRMASGKSQDFIQPWNRAARKLQRDGSKEMVPWDGSKESLNQLQCGVTL